MGFFDDVLRTQGSTEPPPSEVIRLEDYEPSPWQPPTERFLPARQNAADVVAETGQVRIVLAGFSALADFLTMHLHVFRARRELRPEPTWERLQVDGLRVGALMPDGTRVTPFDGAPWQATADGTARPTLQVAARTGSTFHDELTVVLAGLPARGLLTFVLEWPLEGLVETHFCRDAAQLTALARQAVDIWPELPAGPEEPPGQPVQA